MEELEYITKEGLLQCSEGSAPGIFTPTYNTTVKINGCVAATKADMISVTNVPSFVVCKKTNKKCTPQTVPWQNTYPVKVKGQETLIGKSCMTCGEGGKIEFLISGQIPLDAEEKEQLQSARDDIEKSYDEEQKEKDKPWWQKAGEFVVDCVPVVGPVISLVKNISEGNWGMAALDVGFLALDVVGLAAAPFTGGASVAGATVAKAGIRQAVKAGAKQVAKKLSKEALEAGVKQTAEMLSRASLKNLTRGRLCVFACFPAGTPVATKKGLKNIEAIQVGDEVWAYDETNGSVGLKPVINTFERNTGLLVKIEIDGEIIACTPEHPFYANGDWKAAGLLETGDNILLFSGKLASVREIKYEGTHAPVEIDETIFDGPEIIDEKHIKVFNFEVEGWHTYFVGWLQVLVHNTAICAKAIVKKSGEVVYDLTLKFKQGWTKAQKKEALEKCRALTKAKNKTVVKKPPRLPDTRGRYVRSGKTVKKTQDVDHVHELQLGGKDVVGNMKPLNSSVNRSVGSQVNKAIKPLPAGTKIRKVTIK
jgi:Pretoxin HINT domain/Domain of unknown function (DUF4280)